MQEAKIEQKTNIQPRPPVVVVLGHVDHGKTTILDFIRKTKVAEKESGGITQHIGAYEIGHRDKKITFIDTPGHEAFSAMRSRGAKVADVAILVVAGEEGVKPQTKEAIGHIKKAGIPMIIAINKTDKPEANPEKVKRELMKEEVLVESLGGKIPSVNVSAKTGQGIDELLEVILLIAEMENFEGDVLKPAQGLVIEANLDSSRGPTATFLLRDGILRAGDIVGTPSTMGRVKILENFKREVQKEALPSMPVVVIGLEDVPRVGEEFRVFSDAEGAKQYLGEQVAENGSGERAIAEAGQKILNLIIRADVSGSLEAINQVLKNIPQEKIIIKILKAEVGEVNDSDIKLAEVSRAVVISFGVKTNPISFDLAEARKVKILNFDIIYELAQGVRHIMEKMLSPEVVRQDFGKMKVLAVFRTDKSRQIVGGKIVEGRAKKGAQIEVFRNEEKIGKGRIINLQKNKKDADIVAKGDECGILYEGDAKVEEGDTLLMFGEDRKKGEL